MEKINGCYCVCVCSAGDGLGSSALRSAKDCRLYHIREWECLVPLVAKGTFSKLYGVVNRYCRSSYNSLTIIFTKGSTLKLLLRYSLERQLLTTISRVTINPGTG
jgi:hypothetical protein